MNKFKKVLFLALALALTSASFVACGKKGGGNGATSSSVASSESSSEITSSESSSEISSEAESDSSEIESDSSDIGGEVDNTPKANITTATADELAAINEAGVSLYDASYNVVGNAALESAYTFTAAQTVEEAKASEYADWHADYYVSVDTAIEEGQLGLAGSYAAWDDGKWVAFYAPATEANVAVPLLGSVSNSPWTYAEIVEIVNEFKCGVFDNDNACAGLTMTVELRLTNPNDAADCLVITRTQYTFA